MARWAITLGAAGSIVGFTVVYKVLIDGQAAGQSHGMLVLSASLLSLAFVLAPFVRRTFGNPLPSQPAARPSTLLDELRQAPEGTDTPAPAAEPAAPLDSDVAAMPLTTRVIVAVYAIFAATLLVVLWLLQTKQ